MGKNFLIQIDNRLISPNYILLKWDLFQFLRSRMIVDLLSQFLDIFLDLISQVHFYVLFVRSLIYFSPELIMD